MAKFSPFTFGLLWGFRVVVCVPAFRDKLLVGKFHNYTHLEDLIAEVSSFAVVLSVGAAGSERGIVKTKLTTRQFSRCTNCTLPGSEVHGFL